MEEKWRSEWEEKMKMEEQKRTTEWKDDEQKRKDGVEENWRSEWEEKMKKEEQKRKEWEDQQQNRRRNGGKVEERVG